METRRAFYQVARPLHRLIAVGLLLGASMQAGAEGCIEVWDGRRWQSVALAETDEESAAGLSGRPPGGMLFIYPESEVRWFWMQGMSFDLDIVWLDAGQWVVGIDHAAACTEDPCEWIASPEPVRYVLELPAGSTGFASGQRLDWRACRD